MVSPGRAWSWYTSRPGRVKFALWLLTASLIGWPISAVTFARGEPVTVLGLSWLAISITALDVLLTSTVSANQDKDDAEG